MKKYIVLFIIVYFLAGCGAGGGVSNVDNGLITPPSTSKSKVAKIKIKEDGIYKLTFADLNASSVDLSGVSTASLKMTSNGDEIAIDVIDTNKNDIFDEGDSIEFYGRAIPRGDKSFRYTETNVYWLSSEDGIGKRMEKVQSNLASSQGASSFLKVLHNEEDTWYEQKNYPVVSKREDVREHWFWGDRFSGAISACGGVPLEICKDETKLSNYLNYLKQNDPRKFEEIERQFGSNDVIAIAKNIINYFKRSYTFSTYGFDSAFPFSLKLRLQSISGSHHIKAYINGNLVVDGSCEGEQPCDIVSGSVNSSYLKSIGFNTLTIESEGDPQHDDFFYLDWFEVAFYHIFQAEHDKLEFTGNGAISVAGFNSDTISVYDITGYPEVKNIKPAIEDSISGYKALFSTPDNQDSNLIALISSEKKKPLSVEAYTLADLSSSKDVNYIIITHEDFYDVVKPLADYRSNQGYKVLTVKIGDIYNEFSYGVETPQAIKDFLSYAYNNWTTKPKYVLLVGDATFDYKDISGYGKNNGVKSYLPAYLYNYPVLGEVPSDNWFADVDTTNGILPEMNIGRIPAKTAGDVTAVIDKIISHEKYSNKSKNVLLVADDDLVFETLSDSIAGIIPNDYSVTKLYKKNVNAGEFRNSIIDGINSGAEILNYTGHGAVVDWTKEKAFSSEDIVYLKNKGDYPFVVALDCMNGYFVLPDDSVGGQSSSIAESFLLSQERGAVAVFAASSFGYPTDHALLAQELYGKIFEDGITLGEVVAKARETACNYGMDVDGSYRCNGINDDVVETFIFFGDPATKLR